MKKILVMVIIVCFIVSGCASTQALKMEIQQNYAEIEQITDPIEKAEKLKQLREKENEVERIEKENRKTAAIIGGVILLGLAGAAVGVAASKGAGGGTGPTYYSNSNDTISFRDNATGRNYTGTQFGNQIKVKDDLGTTYTGTKNGYQVDMKKDFGYGAERIKGNVY